MRSNGERVLYTLDHLHFVVGVGEGRVMGLPPFACHHWRVVHFAANVADVIRNWMSLAIQCD